MEELVQTAEENEPLEAGRACKCQAVIHLLCFQTTIAEIPSPEVLVKTMDANTHPMGEVADVGQSTILMQRSGSTF